MKKLFLNIYLWIMLFIITSISLIVFPLFILFNCCFKGRSIDASIRLGIVIYGWSLVKIVPFFAPVEVETQAGKLTTPAIFVANHSSAIDPYLFGALGIDACFLSTWPFKIPIYGSFMRFAKYINADEGWEQVSKRCTDLLRSGTSVIIWPEGHRSRDGRLGRFKNGAFALSVETGFPVQPVCIIGSRKFMPPGRMIISPSKIKLIILDPIYPSNQSHQEEEIIKLRTSVKEAIGRTLQGYEENEMHDASHSGQSERGLKC